MQTEQLSAALAGRYSIERQIGQGGMATVYLARDIRHKRPVALKVLKPDLGAVVGTERFLSEIQVTATLQHPNLLPLFDSGEANGLLFYVMPYVEGESLRARLDREKQLPIEEAIHITTAIAEALDYAHRQGVIHRDLKPENILMHQRQPQVADFGIALAVSNAGGNRITQTGLSLGTPQYMSPEQATGDRAIDSRTDIYSLGAVAYEMLVGEPPHTGSTSQAIIARVLTEKPRSLRATRPSIPPHVEAAVEHALEKLPADRWTTAREFAEAIAGVRPTVAAAWVSSSLRTSRWGVRRSGLLAGAVILAAALGVGVFQGNRSASRAPAIYDVGLPERAPLSFTGGSPWGEGWTALSVAPKGDFVVYVALRETNTELWFRSLLDTTARSISGTSGAYNPMLSPDASHVAYFSGKHLMVSPIAGGTPAIIGEVDRPRGGEWISAERIIVADSNGALLRSFDPAARASKVVSRARCSLPHALPGERILCGSRFATSRSIRLSTDTASHAFGIGSGGGDSIPVRLRGSDFRSIGRSILVFMGFDGSLSGATVNLEKHEAGRPVALVAGVRREGFDAPGQYGLSADGTLVFVPGENVEIAKFARLHEDGGPYELPIPAAAHHRFDVTPDGLRLASARYAADGMELWIYNIATGRGERWLRAAYISEPRWDSVGERLIVTVQATSSGPFVTLVGSPGSGSAPDTIMRGERWLTPSAYVSDSLVLGSLTEGRRRYPVRLDLRVRPPRVEPAGVTGMLSPDGRWIAYNTSRAGGWEVYVERFPSDGRSYHVSPNGGIDPMWRKSGALVFRSGSSWYEVSVKYSGSELVGEPRLIFSDPQFIDTYDRSNAMMPDGSIIYVRGGSRATASFLRVVPGFVDQMRRRVR